MQKSSCPYLNPHPRAFQVVDHIFESTGLFCVCDIVVPATLQVSKAAAKLAALAWDSDYFLANYITRLANGDIRQVYL